MSISEWTDRQAVAPRHDGILLSHVKKKETMPFAAIRTDLKIVTLIEARRRHTI